MADWVRPMSAAARVTLRRSSSACSATRRFKLTCLMSIPSAEHIATASRPHAARAAELSRLTSAASSQRDTLTFRHLPARPRAAHHAATPRYSDGWGGWLIGLPFMWVNAKAGMSVYAADL